MPLTKSQFKFDKAKDGWKLLEDAPFTPPADTSNATITAISFLREGESYIHGDEMVKRDREKYKCNLGQGAAEWLLDNQQLIPNDLQGKYLVFTGTIWRISDGSRYVKYLDWCDDRWVLRWYWLDYDYWGGNDRLLRLGESLDPLLCDSCKPKQCSKCGKNI